MRYSIIRWATILDTFEGMVRDHAEGQVGDRPTYYALYCKLLCYKVSYYKVLYCKVGNRTTYCVLNDKVL
jgi:hypothetical protein